MIRVFLVDDHQVLIDGISSRLAQEADLSVVGYALDGVDALRQLAEQSVDVLVLDLDLPKLDGMEVCKRAQRDFPHIQVLILSMHGDRMHVSSVLKLGAKGYVLKNRGADELVTAIRMVQAGEIFVSQSLIPVLAASSNSARSRDSLPRLTRREKEVLRLIVDGLSSVEIGARLHISLKTVESHRANLLEKLQANNTASLVRISLERNLL